MRASLTKVHHGLAMLLALLVALLLPAISHAQQTYIDAALAVEGQVAPGGETRIAIRFSPVASEWHGYWSNPGDAGLGMRIEWDLPDGVTIGEFRYPAPQRLLIGDLMNHIFEGDYAVVAPLRVAEDAALDGPFELAGTAFYLACTDEICVPQEAQLRAVVGVGEGAADPRFAQYQSALAAPLDRPARFAIGQDRLRIAIPLPATLDVGSPHVFVANRNLVAYAQEQSFAREGDTLIAQIPLAGTGERPERITGIVRLGDGTGLSFEAEPGEVAAGGEPLRTGGDAPPLWALLGAALLGGLVLNIMPCVFPILSLKALSLAKAGGEERAARKDALAYTAGVILACLALGGLLLALRASGEAVGWAFQLQEPGVVVALFLLAVALTANFLGAFEIPGMAITGGGASRRGSFATGLLAAFVATPCTGPFMAAALGAALVLPWPSALGLFAALGLGLALPFLLIGLVPAIRQRLPRPGAWMETFRRWMALPMGLTALALAWLVWRIGGDMFAAGALFLAVLVILALLYTGRQQASGNSTHFLWPVLAPFVLVVVFFVLPGGVSPNAGGPSADILDSQPFSEVALAEARDEERPVFLYFTADWCVTCKVNESVAIEREETAEALEAADALVLRGDWTRRDPEITAFLTQQGVAGVPLYLWYAPGAAGPQRLPQVLTPGSVRDLAVASARRGDTSR
ncbi:DsbC/DsbD-like thiol-disulfide interchange protein/cytochrome c biogenesis protein CcdA [Erythrobacter lutimaris]|nr:thioredoxin family protein [Alteriqipengyuania lutimaris]MBB3033914.1 DsbC/DsbD-like thiol-disulfide interchange protein/cytochrome c biogenesis protein CcdA [Alteriqipengyuania lutimaris]